MRSPRASGQFLHGALVIFVSLQFGFIGTCVETLSLPFGQLVFGLLDFSAKT